MITRRRLVAFCVVLAAVLPYLPTLDDYFVQDDFGVVSLLSTKPAGYFPRWFISPWMDDIWGDPPDEIRPFPAVTYQIAALPGAGSPVANHAINIGFHAINALLVLRIGETAAGLPLGPAALAAVLFAILPMQTESVAWVTGRVDSMPACFYLLSFLLYERWRARGRASLYIWSVIACFVALFTKQNAVTLPAALILYDAIVARHPVRPSWNWIRPYVPFVLLTAGYLALRYVLFGEVARESSLNEVRLQLFLDNVSVHLKRMVFGEAGVALSNLNALVRVGAGAAIVGAVATFARDYTRAMIRPALYFLVVWVALGLAPTLVAGYGSPRHMYLASVGWALSLSIALGAFWHARAGRLDWTMKAIGGVFATAVLVMYGSQLRAEVRLWGIRSEVSHRIVRDLEREATSAPRGSLLLVDPPPRSWNFALPFALRPPFTREDLPSRVLVISHSSIHCCASNYWEPYTRRTVRTWLEDSTRPPIIALRWDPDTGALFRLSESDDPFLRTVVATLLDTPDVTTLDRLILNITRRMVVREVER
ncbi:MAG TPA: hypothetical protein VJ865_14535 [Gemmatimonadaceae bacterium]|nr:hypothetical protein [Gemmatimonadaceae bacterium]